MRNINTRPPLSSNAQSALTKATNKSNHITEYKRIRGLKWFKNEIVETLKSMSGPGNRCMYCSNSASSDVEHFFPKSEYPEKTFDWDNMLWVCTDCNRRKGNQFPVDEQQNHVLIDPVTENVWDYFFIDELGFLTPVYDVVTDTLNKRATETLKIFGLETETEERGYLREGRKRAYDQLITWIHQQIQHLKDNSKSRECIVQELEEERRSPIRPDVADYFLNGPGREEKPFKEFFEQLKI